MNRDLLTKVCAVLRKLSPQLPKICEVFQTAYMAYMLAGQIAHTNQDQMGVVIGAVRLVLAIYHLLGM